MENSAQITAVSQRFLASTTAWEMQEEETTRLQQQLEESMEKRKQLLEEMQRDKARLDDAMFGIVSRHTHDHQRSTTSSTNELVEVKNNVGVVSESRKKETIGQDKSTTESSSKTRNNNVVLVHKTCSSKDAVAIIQPAPSDIDESHFENAGVTEMPSAVALPNENDKQADHPVARVIRLDKPVRKEIVNRFLLQNRGQICAILTGMPRTPAHEILHIQLEKGRVPEHIQQQYEIRHGVQRARGDQQKFVIALYSELLSSKRLGLDSCWTHFEDPRDASKALEAVELLFHSFKRNEEEDGANATTTSTVTTTVTTTAATATAATTTAALTTAALTTAAATAVATVASLSPPQKRVRVEDARPAVASSTPSNARTTRIPRASAEKAKQNIGKQLHKKKEYELFELKEEHQKRRPFPLSEANVCQPSDLLDQVVSYRQDPNHWQLFKIAESDSERQQVRLKEFSDDDANPPPAGFVGVEHVFVVQDIGFRGGAGVCIECGEFDERELEDEAFVSDSIQCEGCGACFHFECAGISPPLPENRHWICHPCTQEQKHRMKPATD